MSTYGDRVSALSISTYGSVQKHITGTDRRGGRPRFTEHVPFLFHNVALTKNYIKTYKNNKVKQMSKVEQWGGVKTNRENVKQINLGVWISLREA